MPSAARLLPALLLLSGRVPVSPQTAATSPAGASTRLPSYDVATVKPNTSGSGNTSVWTHDVTLQAENVRVRDLLVEAFGVRRNLIFGLPAWAETARFDINAKIVDPDPAQLKKLTLDQRRAMLRSLLEDRFGLQWHFATREMPTYDLVVAKGGPKLKQSVGNSDHTGTHMNNTDLTVTNEPLSGLADLLSDQLERPVVDHTGLTAKFDFHLRWTREEDASHGEAGKDTDDAPPLFNALQDQLGLKLQPGKDPVQTLVVDRLAPPTAD